jgi:hypothetical protein
MTLFIAIIGRDLGDMASLAVDDADKKRRDDSAIWKSKQHAIQLMHRIFQRYHNIPYLKGYYIHLATIFQT